jgi:hypothetical protein
MRVLEAGGYVAVLLLVDCGGYAAVEGLFLMAGLLMNACAQRALLWAF